MRALYTDWQKIRVWHSWSQKGGEEKKETILDELVLTGVQNTGMWIHTVTSWLYKFSSIGESRSNTKFLQFRWVTTERTRPCVHIYNFASKWARAAGVSCLHFSKELYSAHWAVPMHVNAKHYTARHTCCGSLMSVHFSSFTCSKNPTASHTKSSGMLFKVTLSTLLCTRLPAGRQVQLSC